MCELNIVSENEESNTLIYRAIGRSYNSKRDTLQIGETYRGLKSQLEPGDSVKKILPRITNSFFSDICKE